MQILNYDQASGLWLEYQKALNSYVLKKVKDKDTANEITHQVLMKIYASCCSGREIQKVDSWLFMIAHNAIVDHWAKEKKNTQEIPEDLQSEGDNVWNELTEYVVPLIRLLPEKYAIPLLLSDIEGHKQADIARELNLGLSATKSRIQRGRELLQKEIYTCCSVEKDPQGNILGFAVKDSCAPLQEFRKNNL
jgi:RNA polymerase sigma-70 factor, ECF subfamily